MGQPSTYTTEIGNEICARLAEGEPLRVICRDEHMPAWRTVYDWIDADAEFAAHIAHARQLGFDAIAESTMEIIDAAPDRDPNTGKIDPAWVQHQKLRAEHRLKLLAKWSPKKYGEKIDHTSSDGSMSPPTAIQIVHVKPDSQD